MRAFVLVVLFVLNSFALTLQESKLLLNRTTFGYTLEDLKTFSKFSKSEAVNYLLNSVNNDYSDPNIKKLKELSTFVKLKNLEPSKRKEFRKKKMQAIRELQVWWYSLMVNSKYSFREKMTLFWHNHFTSSYKKVNNPYFIYLQNELLDKMPWVILKTLQMLLLKI